MKKSTRYAAVVLAAFCLGYGIVFKMFYALAIGILLGVAMLFEKKMSITEDGLEMDYRLLVNFYHEVWEFGEIESIHREKVNASGLVPLNFMKGLSGKRLLFPVETAEKVIQVALESNKEIYYDIIER